MGLGQGRILKSTLMDIYRYLLLAMSHQHHCSGKRRSGFSMDRDRLRIEGQRKALIFDGWISALVYLSQKNSSFAV